MTKKEKKREYYYNLTPTRRKKKIERSKNNYYNYTLEQYDNMLKKQKIYRRKIRMEAMIHIMHGIKPLCIICGEDFFPLLQIDHINNDGNKWRKIHGYSNRMYRWLKKNNYPSEPELQILCANCNNLKRLGILII